MHLFVNSWKNESNSAWETVSKDACNECVCLECIWPINPTKNHNCRNLSCGGGGGRHHSLHAARFHDAIEREWRVWERSEIPHKRRASTPSAVSEHLRRGGSGTHTHTPFAARTCIFSTFIHWSLMQLKKGCWIEREKEGARGRAALKRQFAFSTFSRKHLWAALPMGHCMRRRKDLAVLLLAVST
jgi:ribosomal protein L40E